MYGVAAEVRTEGFFGESIDFGLGAPALKVDELVTCDIAGKAGTAVAQNAPLAVHENVFVEGNWFFVAAFFFDKAAFAGAVGHGLVLQGALAAFVANRAIQWVVDEQEFQHAVLGFGHGF